MTLLKRLKDSARNSKYLDSPKPIWNARKMERSTFLLASETYEFTFSLPYVYGAWTANASVLNHCAGVCRPVPLFGSPTTSTRCCRQQPMFSGSALLVIV